MTVLEEQSDVMRRWLAGRKWGYPPETARDPADGARIDWEDHLPDCLRQQAKMRRLGLIA